MEIKLLDSKRLHHKFWILLIVVMLMLRN